MIKGDTVNALPTEIGDRVTYLGPKAGDNPNGFVGTVVLIGHLSDEDETPYVAVNLDETGNAVLVTDAADLDPA